LKVRPDVIPTMTGDFVDLKTAADVTTPALQYAIRAYGYHQQGALIWEVVEQLGAEHPFAGFVLMFVETVAPWCAHRPWIWPAPEPRHAAADRCLHRGEALARPRRG
jgi:hypothetical protein